VKGRERGRVSGRARIHERENARENENYRSLLQNVVSFIGLFCKRDLSTRPIPRVRGRTRKRGREQQRECVWQNDLESDGERKRVTQIACVA